MNNVMDTGYSRIQNQLARGIGTITILPLQYVKQVEQLTKAIPVFRDKVGNYSKLP